MRNHSSPKLQCPPSSVLGFLKTDSSAALNSHSSVCGKVHFKGDRRPRFKLAGDFGKVLPALWSI